MELLDNKHIESALPDGIELPTWYRRTFAATLDMIIIVGLGWMFWEELETLLILIVPLYKTVLEGSIGATVGKKVLGLKLVTNDGQGSRINIWQANKRFLFAWPWYVFLYLIITPDALLAIPIEVNSVILFCGLWGLAIFSAVSYLFDAKQQAWYDRLANTICIKKTVKL